MIPHDLKCSWTRLVVQFGTPEALESLRNRDHAAALVIADVAVTADASWVHVETCRAIVENRPLNTWSGNASKAP